jgi:putative membrane protein
MMSPLFAAAPAAIAGTLVSSLLACIPGLHVYNIMGLLALTAHAAVGAGHTIPTEIALPFAVGLMVGYSVLNTIPSILLAAPDESAMFTVLPGQKFFLSGRGLEGILITTIGSAAGLILLLAIVGPLAPAMLPTAQTVLRPHVHWILWCVIAFMLMSEWPKSRPTGQAGWGRFLDSWKSTGMGLITFGLAGLLGFILYFRTPIAVGAAFQNLMPAFVGLFTIPWLLLNLANNLQPPEQLRTCAARLDPAMALRGAFAGALGGGFAAFFPVVTGGIGGLLAGHATAIRNDRTFLISQGTSKLTYYVGGLLLFFVPGLGVTRGGGAWIISGIITPYGRYEYLLALGAIAIGGACALLLVAPLTRLTLTAIARIGYRPISLAAVLATVAIVGGITGWRGLCVMLVATGIGLLPVLFGARRMNCLGVILLPMACNMSGVGTPVAQWLGLL